MGFLWHVVSAVAWWRWDLNVHEIYLEKTRDIALRLIYSTIQINVER